MNTILKLRDKAKTNKKKIILPEYDDPRVIEAAEIIVKEGIADVIFLTKEMMKDAEKVRYAQQYFSTYKAKDVTMESAQELFEDTLYYGSVMVAEGKADGIVAGASHTTPDVARAYMRCIGIEPRLSVMASCFIMAVPNCPYGEEGTFIFADCGIIPEPNSRQLACISVAAAELAQKVLALEPRIAFLSYSTKGSAKTKSAEKIDEALQLVKEMNPSLLADGELQVDAAIVPDVAKIKYPDSPVKGRANILIFPNLEAGNIGYKLSQRLANARAVGPLIIGLNNPASDLSRGCSIDDVVDCVAATAIRAQ